MATAEFKATIEATGNARASGSGLVTAAQSAGTLGAAVTAAMAVLVADGATPTQAHVNTANAAWVAYVAAVDAITPDVTVYIGTVANIATKNKLRAALDAIFRVVQGSNLLTD